MFLLEMKTESYDKARCRPERLGRAGSGHKNVKLVELLGTAAGIGRRRLDQLVAQNRDIAGSFDPDPYLIAFHLHDRDLDVWTDHD
jgi:hypothetical protein